MKKLLAVLVVLAALLALASAVSADVSDAAYLDTSGDPISGTLAAGESVIYSISSGYNYTVSGNVKLELVSYGRGNWVYVEQDMSAGSCTFENGDFAGWYYINITNETDAEQSYTVSWSVICGTVEYPEELSIAAQAYTFVDLSMAMDTTYYYCWTATEAGMLSVDGYGWQQTGFYFEVNTYSGTDQWGHASADNGYVDTVSVSVVEGDYVVISVYAPSDSDLSGELDFYFTPASSDDGGAYGGTTGSGSWDDPVAAELNTMYYIDMAGNNDDYYYMSWTAPATGTLTIELYCPLSGWAIVVDDYTDYIYGDTVYGEEIVTVEVVEGHEYSLHIMAYDEESPWTANECTVYFIMNMDVETGAGDPDDGESGNTGSAEGTGAWDAPVSAELDTTYTIAMAGNNDDYYYMTWTADYTGTVIIEAFSLDCGWSFTFDDYTDYIYSDTFFNAESVTMDVVAGHAYSLHIMTYDETSPWTAPEGTVYVYMYKGTVTDGSTGGEEGEEGGDSGDTELAEKYADYSNSLVLGDNIVTSNDTAHYTLMKFYPETYGDYKITISNGTVSRWFGSSASAGAMDESIAESSEITVTYSAGNCIWIGIRGADNATLTIELVQEKEEENTPAKTYTYVEATETPVAASEDITDWTWVNVLDDTVDFVVLGEDGFYHLNGEDGPKVYLDLDTARFNLILSEANSTGSLKDAINYVNYKYLVDTYSAEGSVVALTSELMEMLMNVGASKGWYSDDLNMNIFGQAVLDDAWMFACKYETPDEDPVSPIEPGDDTNVPTGDTDICMVAALAVVSAMSIVALPVVKKHF